MKALIKLISVLCCIQFVACSKEEAAPEPEAPPHPGLAIWEGTCKVCHGVGLAGAPIAGNQKAWAKRLARGKESMYGHALKGWGDMPARGGNTDLTDEEVKLAVDYMVSLVE